MVSIRDLTFAFFGGCFFLDYHLHSWSAACARSSRAKMSATLRLQNVVPSSKQTCTWNISKHVRFEELAVNYGIVLAT